MGASRRTIREWVAGKLGRRHDVTIALDTGTTLDIPDLSDKSEDDERFMDAYIEWLDSSVPADPVMYWRRITSASTSLNQATINRAFSPSPANDTEAHIYELLNPDEWNECINTALTKLYFEERHDVTIDDDLTPPDYVMPSWIQNRGQIMDVKYRRTSDGWETPVPQYSLRDNRNEVTLHIVGKQWSSASYSIVVVAKRYYPRLTEEDWGTTCPTPLWEPAVQVACTQKILSKYGSRFREAYKMDLAIAEKELMEAKSRFLPVITTREYVPDENWEGVDMGWFFEESGWV